MRVSYATLILCASVSVRARSQAPASQQPACMPGMAMPGCPAPKPDAAAAPHPVIDLPAPDLLKDVAKRAPMKLEEFLSLADGNNPTLAQAAEQVKESEAQARQASLYPNPSVGYQGEQIRGGSYGGGEQGGFVQQTIVLGGKLGLRRDIYTQQKNADELSLKMQSLRVHADITQAFYTALTAQAVVVMRQRLLAVSLDAVETVHQLANVGQADAPDILQAEVEAEQAKVDFVVAQRDFVARFRVLATFAGKPSVVICPLAGNLEDPPQFEGVARVETIVTSSPAIQRMQQQIAVSEARLRDAKRESTPDLQIRAGEQYNLEHLTGTPQRATGFQSFASVGIDLPLWNRNQGNVAAAQVELERTRQDVLREQLVLRQSAEQLSQSYESARFTADRYRTQLIPRAQRAYQLYLAKYQSLASAYPQVLVSQRTLFQLQIGYLTALHEVWTNAVGLQNFALQGGLDQPVADRDARTMPGRSSDALP